MKNSFLVFCVITLILSSTACIGALGPTGAIYTNITGPGSFETNTMYQVTPESDYEGVAYVEGTSKGEVILGLVAVGNFGYGAAVENALSKAPGATRLIDVIVDFKITSILGLYTVYTTTVRGRAVKIKK